MVAFRGRHASLHWSSPLATATVIKASSLPAEDLTSPFIESATSIFSMMLGWDLTVGELSRSNRFQSNHDISGVIGFSGALRGSIVIGINQDVAFAAAEAFFGGKPTEIDAEVLDMVGELSNMIGGNAKERMTTTGVTLGLPMVISGKGHRISFDPVAQVVLIPFESPQGNLTVEVAIRPPDK
jgi:chemotaxis protein CheX